MKTQLRNLAKIIETEILAGINNPIQSFLAIVFVLFFFSAVIYLSNHGISCLENYPLGEKIDSILFPVP
jgi:hypothetical protein